MVIRRIGVCRGSEGGRRPSERSRKATLMEVRFGGLCVIIEMF
jgi:hypothetical protein